MSFEDLNWHGKRGVILARDNYECQECYRPATEVDHCWPRAFGGGDTEDNLRAICKACNQTKGDSLLIKFLTEDTAWATYLHHAAVAQIALREATKFWNMSAALGRGADPDDFADAGPPTGNDVLERGDVLLRLAAKHGVSEQPTDYQDPTVPRDRPWWVNAPDRICAA